MASKGAPSRFRSLSPLDYRYWDEEVADYLDEEARIRQLLQVELALIQVFAERSICPQWVVSAVEQACSQVTTNEAYDEEDRIGHDIRGLVNKLNEKLVPDARRFVHRTATSYDIIDTAMAFRYKAVTEHVLAPRLRELIGVLISLSLNEAETVQVGRTHGQHAVPITVGFTIASYIHRLGDCLDELMRHAGKLQGKFSGAVGAFNASSLLMDDPEQFEADVLAKLGLEPALFSTQIVPPEALIRLLVDVVMIGGVLAQIARDMRHLQRTEIGEFGEPFAPDQVGSSTMAQKQNPINFENIESMWKIIMPRILTVLLDQISEHQRDLTGSASARTYGEIIAYVVSMIKRMTRVMRNLTVHPANLERNLNLQMGAILAEPLYILLAEHGHTDAHEKVRQVSLEARRLDTHLQVVVAQDHELQPYLQLMTDHQRAILTDPRRYTGIAAKRARAVAELWQLELGLAS